jgi:dipeptidyl aminopeptidase/acylaminoacyl peptidase
VRAEDMVEPYLVHYPSKDGKWTISAFVYVPYNLPRNGQHPAIVYVHGGPAAQTVNNFNRFVQYMANQGYLVIAPNYRGSTGYGKNFSRRIFSIWAAAICRMCSRRRLDQANGLCRSQETHPDGRQLRWLLTMMGVTKAPELWAAGVPIVPFVNWFTEIENEDPVLQQSTSRPWAIR